MIVNNIHLTIPGTSGASSLNEGFRIRGFSCPYDQLTAGERGAPNAYSRLCCYNLEASESLCVLGALWDAKIFFQIRIFSIFSFFSGWCMFNVYFFFFTFLLCVMEASVCSKPCIASWRFAFVSEASSVRISESIWEEFAISFIYSCFGIFHHENYMLFYFLG